MTSLDSDAQRVDLVGLVVAGGTVRGCGPTGGGLLSGGAPGIGVIVPAGGAGPGVGTLTLPGGGVIGTPSENIGPSGIVETPGGGT